MRLPRVFLILVMLSAVGRLWADTPDSYYLAGFDYYAHRDYAKSIPYLRAAVQLDPQNWKAWQTLGFDYYLSGQPMLAVPAFDQSLRWHPDNFQIRDLAEGIRAKMIWEAERNDPYPRVFRNYGIWVKLHGGVISASLGDLTKGAPAFQSYYGARFGNVSATVDGFGPLVGLEVGFMLDTYDAWCVSFDGAAFNGYRASAADNYGYSLKGAIQPNMISIQAGYFHYFKLGRTRLWAGGGGGFYDSIVELSYVQDAVTLQSGEMAGVGYGGFLGLGWDMAVGDQISASVYVRGRYATTGDIEGLVSYFNGAAQQSVLVSDATGPYAAPVGTPGAKTVNIDYTGFDTGLAITYHY